MDRLPADIISEIVSYLGALKQAHYGLWKSNLSPYATINKTWQSVIEHDTFSRIKIDADTLPELIPLLSGATGDRRIRSIRALEFQYLIDWMPALTPTQHSELREQERLANESFSGDMRALFGLLKGWEERLGGNERVVADRHQLRLFLIRGWDRGAPHPPHPTEENIISPRPADAPPDAPVVHHGRHFSVIPWKDFRLEVDRRFPRPYLQYIGEEKLPELSLVSSVIVCEGHDIHPESLIRILSRMKCLDCFIGYLFDETENLDLTREYRKALAQCLHLLPRSLSVLSPRFLPPFLKPLTSNSVLVDPERDELCLGIRALSCQLRKLDLSGLRISPAIFAGDGDGSYPDWSNLQEVEISYPVISSAGQWFANRTSPEVVAYVDPDDDYGYSTYYSMPDPKLLNELYAAAGKAKQHMPSLKSMHLTLNVDIGKHKFTYYFDQERKRNMIALESSIPFGFSEEVAEAWGFSLDEVNSFKDGNATFNDGSVTVSEVIVT
ncbi:hypothetical protein VF21_10596 [Pseudogymnoascus sp. 05NY08]|nr:hypothetical protein VF21_10596 [Pseudogymnoascus sp. 05NY08]